MNAKYIVIGLALCILMPTIAYPNKIKDVEYPWGDDESRAISSSPSLSIDDSNIYIYSEKQLDCLTVQIIDARGIVLYNDMTNVPTGIEYPISIESLPKGNYQIYISQEDNYIIGYFEISQ